MEPDKQALKVSTLGTEGKTKPFFVVRGDVVSNIDDLANCIQSLSDEQFKHHVTMTKNDFAAWIYGVLKNPFLARDLDLAGNRTNKVQYVKTIRDHVAWLRN